MRVTAILLGFILLVLPWVRGSNGKRLDEPIKPVPMTIDLDRDKVSLGKKLFHEKKLSGDDSISCATCHDLKKGGVDGLQFSVGIDDQVGGINAPTVFNSGYNISQFWNGRAEDLETQVDGPVENPIEMGAKWDQVLKKLKDSPDYVRRFDAVYKDGITRENVKDAIATFERSLITPHSPFDRYLRGDDSALTEEEKQGYQKFKEYGCTACHQGVNVGGNLYQVFGVLNNYFQERGNITDDDLGRYLVTKDERDKHVFKVPGLRMVAHTAPYLHDGTAKTLRDAVDVMFKYQLGRVAPDEDKDAIVAFLKSLAGTYQEQMP